MACIIGGAAEAVMGHVAWVSVEASFCAARLKCARYI